MTMNVGYAQRQAIFGVDYTHIDLGDQGDLYLTDHGVPFADCLLPQNFWSDREWFNAHSRRLSGTSSVYHVRTKEIKDRSCEVVLKWNRMGQPVPGYDDEATLQDVDFNSPFEEFALVMELRESLFLSRTPIAMQKPLAVFVPPERVDLWRTGRKEYMMQPIIEKHVDIQLDMYRSYAMIYEWVKGVDAAQACAEKRIDEQTRIDLTLDADHRLRELGYQVVDRKPHHVIVRPRDDHVLRDHDDQIRYALVDFELLSHTPEREEVLAQEKRGDYLRRQRDRFAVDAPTEVPDHLQQVQIMGVDYIYGPCESTEGALWVVGRDPCLFDYFQPERWQNTARTKLSAYNEIYHTVSRDHINLVWKVSKVGIVPDMDPIKPDEKEILHFGYNSPFEEIAMAIHLTKSGIATIYPRAIYMTGTRTGVTESLYDESRYKTHEQWLTPDTQRPILRGDRDYILIWGYWNGPDEKLADEDSNWYEGIDALRAYREGWVSEKRYLELTRKTKQRMRDAGVIDLNLRGSHLLLSMLSSTRHLITGADGLPEVRICNFELLRKLANRQGESWQS